ncbi:hypothetical protein QBC37DRAFT_400151 [Rhypophila decipiens]|uniref:Uncharacterized protein n=1 Tax=Rhypophila decipiens TaxID=261697 RepID=A0AAN6Y866_9PEZI|nr:hypothetical protein QBC37DRAFT_400151 [Rhypophila decipiens]
MSSSAMLHDDGTNPKEIKQWLDQIRSTVSYRNQIHSPADVEIKKLFQYEASRKVPSASKIGKEDVLHFKILWVSHEYSDLFRKDKWAEFVSPEVAKDAISLVKNNTSIKEYINGAETNAKIGGQFANIHRLQQVVKSTEDKPDMNSNTQKVGMVPRRSTRLAGGGSGVGDITQGIASLDVSSSGNNTKKIRGGFRQTIKMAFTPGKSKENSNTKGKNIAPATTATSKRDDETGSGRSSAAGSDASAVSFSSILSPGGMLPINAQAEDEEVVNVALVAYLITLGLQAPTSGFSKVQWMPSRKQFYIGQNVCEARTDGYLKALAFPDTTLAICEVKPFTRKKVRTQLEWQEGCQMAAWISHMANTGQDDEAGLGLLHSPDDNLRRRLLVSQDHQQIYITIAEYGDKYVKYLFDGEMPRNSGSSAGMGGHSSARTSGSSGSGWVDNGFLTMNTYGPFSTMQSSHRRALCTILYAFTEQLSLPLRNKMNF